MADREHDHPSNKGLRGIGKSLFGQPEHGPSISTIAKQEFGKRLSPAKVFVPVLVCLPLGMVGSLAGAITAKMVALSQHESNTLDPSFRGYQALSLSGPNQPTIVIALENNRPVVYIQAKDTTRLDMVEDGTEAINHINRMTTALEAQQQALLLNRAVESPLRFYSYRDMTIAYKFDNGEDVSFHRRFGSVDTSRIDDTPLQTLVDSSLAQWRAAREAILENGYGYSAQSIVALPDRHNVVEDAQAGLAAGAVLPLIGYLSLMGFAAGGATMRRARHRKPS